MAARSISMHSDRRACLSPMAENGWSSWIRHTSCCASWVSDAALTCRGARAALVAYPVPVARTNRAPAPAARTRGSLTFQGLTTPGIDYPPLVRSHADRPSIAADHLDGKSQLATVDDLLQPSVGCAAYALGGRTLRASRTPRSPRWPCRRPAGDGPASRPSVPSSRSCSGSRARRTRACLPRR